MGNREAATIVALGLAALVGSCDRLRPAPADLRAAQQTAQCERVWVDMGAGQRASFGSREPFVSVCRTSPFVAACEDGYVEVGKAPKDFCAGRGGVKTWRKSPDA